METTKNELKEVIKPTEKERLELIEKRVEIQKKRLEVKKEKMAIGKVEVEKEKFYLELAEKKVGIKSKLLENRKEKIEMEEILVNRKLEADGMLNDKIFSVLISLTVNTIDEERTILGSEPFYTPLLCGNNREIALNKLMTLISRL